jgi:hypothetical protein
MVAPADFDALGRCAGRQIHMRERLTRIQVLLATPARDIQQDGSADNATPGDRLDAGAIQATDGGAGVVAVPDLPGRTTRSVLAREGTTASELIRNERLDLARTRVTSAAFNSYSIADVAVSVGYTPTNPAGPSGGR